MPGEFDSQADLDAALVKMTIGWNSELFMNKLGQLADEIIPHMGVAIEEIVNKAFETVVTETPETRKGHTSIKDLWKIDYSVEGTIQEYIIRNLYPNQDILWYMEEGTRPHVILPVKGTRLRWVDEETGEEIFARIVRHPGTRAYEMIRKGKEMAEPLIEAYIDLTFAQVEKLQEQGITHG